MKSLISLLKFIKNTVFWGFIFILTIFAWNFWKDDQQWTSGVIFFFILYCLKLYLRLGQSEHQTEKAVCPQCHSKKYYPTGEKEELDRWRGSKEVKETSASGKTVTRHIACTFVENQYVYQCTDCNHQGTVIKKEER